MDVDTAKLRTAVQLWEHLAGVEQKFWVKSAFDALLMSQIDLSEHHRHQVALLDANAVLSREHAANLHAQTQDIGTKRFGLL